MGRETAGPECFEGRMTSHLEQLFSRWGWQTERQLVPPGRADEPARENLVARLAPDNSGPLLLLEAHQDTVPVEGMSIPPFEPSVREGRVYGRGACDIKGGMACLLAALRRVQLSNPVLLQRVAFAATANEEHGFTGSRRLADGMLAGTSLLLGRLPAAAVVSEPTELHVVVAHKGVVRWCCPVRGRGAYCLSPERGVNAIYRMGPVLAALDRFDREVLAQRPVDPYTGRPTLSVGTVRGGLSVNTVPDYCTIEIDRRLLPGEDPHAIRNEVINYTATEIGDSLGEAILEHGEPYIVSPGLAAGPNAALAEELSEQVRRCGFPSRIVGVPYGTDAPPLAAAGVQTVVFGPGSIAQAHTHNEWIAVEQLEAATAVYEHWLAERAGNAETA